MTLKNIYLILFIGLILYVVLRVVGFTNSWKFRENNENMMMTNIRHNPKHDCGSHSSREHEDSWKDHDHVAKNELGSYYPQERLRFNFPAITKPWEAVKRCK